MKQNKAKNWKLIVAGLIVISVIAGAVFLPGSAERNEFVASSDDLNAQFDASTENYTYLSASAGYLRTHLSAELSSARSTDTNQDDIQSNLNKLTKTVTTACAQKQIGTTSANVDSVHYPAETKKMLKSFDASDYSDTGVCENGGLMVAYYTNLASLAHGLVISKEIDLENNEVTNKQLAILGNIANIDGLQNEALLRKKLPLTTTYLNELQSLLSQQYDLTEARYDNQPADPMVSENLKTQSKAITKAQKKYEQEINDFVRMRDKAGLAAAEQQINLLDKIAKDRPAIKSDLRYDTPVFWLVVAKVDLASEADKRHSYPNATSTNELVDVLGGVKLTALNKRGLLDTVSYNSLGKKQSGRTITTTAPTGTQLIDTITAE